MPLQDPLFARVGRAGGRVPRRPPPPSPTDSPSPARPASAARPAVSDSPSRAANGSNTPLSTPVSRSASATSTAASSPPSASYASNASRTARWSASERSAHVSRASSTSSSRSSIASRVGSGVSTRMLSAASSVTAYSSARSSSSLYTSRVSLVASRSIDSAPVARRRMRVARPRERPAVVSARVSADSMASMARSTPSSSVSSSDVFGPMPQYSSSRMHGWRTAARLGVFSCRARRRRYRSARVAAPALRGLAGQPAGRRDAR